MSSIFRLVRFFRPISWTQIRSTDATTLCFSSSCGEPWDRVPLLARMWFYQRETLLQIKMFLFTHTEILLQGRDWKISCSENHIINAESHLRLCSLVKEALYQFTSTDTLPTQMWPWWSNPIASSFWIETAFFSQTIMSQWWIVCDLSSCISKASLFLTILCTNYVMSSETKALLYNNPFIVFSLCGVFFCRKQNTHLSAPTPLF